jgi:hypothetical protein
MSGTTYEFDALLKSLRMLAGDWRDDVPADGSFHSDGISEGVRNCGRKLQQLLADYTQAVEGAPLVEQERFALVEQMGFRRVYGTVRETELVGKKMLEVTELGTGQVRLVGGDSLYQVTWLTRDQAESAAITGTRAVAVGSLANDRAIAGWADDDDDADDDDHADRCADSLEDIEDRA